MSKTTPQSIRQLARLLHDTPSEADCQACLDQLEQYINAQQRGQNYQQLFPLVARHMDQCVDCAESYALLYEVLIATVLPQPSRIPAPQLGFLRESQVQANARLLFSALRQAGRQLTIQFSEALLTAYDMLQFPAAAPVLRSSATQPRYDIPFRASSVGFEQIQVQIYLSSQDEYVTVRLQILQINKDWPDLGGVSVNLRYGNSQTSRVTDPWGEVVFEQIPRQDLSSLQLQIEAAVA